MSNHHVSYRVYYEDTDAGGVVYYANYLKYAERARTEWLRSLGVNQSTLAEEKNLIFAVRHVEMDLRRPARLDDLIDITTEITERRGASLVMQQTLRCRGEIMIVIHVTIACLNTAFKPIRLPDFIS